MSDRIVRSLETLGALLLRLRAETRGASAVEFAIILPFMLLVFLGTYDLCNGIAADRKVTITARTLSDLIAQATSVKPADVTNSFTAASYVMMPFGGSPVQQVSQIKIDATSTPTKSTIQWSLSSTGNGRPTNQSVTVPSGLVVSGQVTYLIWSEVSYTYTPFVSYVFKSAFALSDQFYARPRQSACVLYNGATGCT
ncbi:pilus assembly protein [Bradyrhizobium sp. U87765 SZCCT0131]|nr:pilus assembly protein [Bradyrhizobium sp. U87765 SZCCT0131]MBR1263703.1 pilus assembly protein [Bradyrhizobium sp. U87765 SZCCT0134]MBR1302727.1 pilus assembly protein [Bradyrhizobium sp. U87765 SZCCT0110]MBR1319953.1 pilus assembly protein [Bradyrhizobium sp. U87765 SZCCT0109]MBR1348934.1 pilus assembly protein [Bradyrhizobium sp. U87765 SZCCT0048]